MPRTLLSQGGVPDSSTFGAGSFGSSSSSLTEAVLAALGTPATDCPNEAAVATASPVSFAFATASVNSPSVSGSASVAIKGSAVALADAAESTEQPDYRVVARQLIIDALAVAAALDERGAAEKLQVSRCIGEGEARTGRQILDAALALSEMFEQFEPMRVGKRMGDLGETLKNPLFRTHS